MSRVISFRDLQRIPELSKFSEAEILHPSMDAKVKEYLEALGFDIRKPVLYVPAVHRDLAGNVALGFYAAGEVNNDPNYLRSALCPTIERLVAIARKDLGLAFILSRMMGCGVDLTDEGLEEEDSNLPDEYYEPDADEVSALIQFLTHLRDHIRGTPHNAETGALKTLDEYQVA